MRKILLILLFLILLLPVKAQDVVGGKLDPYSRNRLISISFPEVAEKDTIHNWKIIMKHSFLFNQLMVDNWVAGGVNSFSGTAKLNYETYYKKGKNRWINRLNAAYGFKNQADDNHDLMKTEDAFDFTSSYRYALKKQWYLAASFNIKSQFDAGYDYTTTPKTKISGPFSPGYITIGGGVDYVHKDKLEISIHPLSARAVIVSDPDLRSRYSLDPDESVKLSVGTYLGVRHKMDLFKNVKMENSAGLYSEYNRKPFNFDLAYRLILDMKINDFMSTNVSFESLYDDDQIGRWQIKQSLGIGLMYRFENHVEKKKEEPKP